MMLILRAICERCQYVVMGLTHITTNSKLYKLGGELGKGGFGVVYAAVRRADKLQVFEKEDFRWKPDGEFYATSGDLQN